MREALSTDEAQRRIKGQCAAHGDDMARAG
jgi:hypothetical protein